jgi:hypothetical protein
MEKEKIALKEGAAVAAAPQCIRKDALFCFRRCA